jgi:hypothetical protein
LDDLREKYTQKNNNILKKLKFDFYKRLKIVFKNIQDVFSMTIRNFKIFHMSQMCDEINSQFFWFDKLKTTRERRNIDIRFLTLTHKLFQKKKKLTSEIYNKVSKREKKM